MRVSFFKTQKPKRFGFVPRYYNEAEERKQELHKRQEEAQGIREKSYESEKLRVEIRQNWSRLRRTSGRTQQSGYRLIIIIAVLTIIVWWLLFR